jgi:CheY-like chemotaxis protein
MSSEQGLWFGSDMPSNAPAASAQDTNPSVMPTRRVLIVEDELFVAWHLETLAREFGLDVVGLVPDGEGAVEQSADAKLDLVLMDINLAGEMDGVEAARRICERNSVPVIFITAFADAATLGRIHKATPDAQVLAKPVSAERLNQAIAKAFAGRPQ